MNDDLEQRVEVLRKEVDGLQAAAAEKSRPWYRNVSTLLSVIALAFSFGTTFVSYHRTNMQDIQNARTELRTLLQRLSALPKENLEAGVKYAMDPASRNTVAGFINQENTLLASNAAEIAKKLPANAVSATEYYAIAVALQAAYDLAGADEFCRRAMAAQPEFSTEISCLRMIANLKFIQQKPDVGRAEYKKALDIFSKYQQYDPYTRALTNILTELSWAFSEANSNRFDLAEQHIQSAEKILQPWPPSPGVNGLKAQVAQARAQVEMGSPPPNPNPGGQIAVPTPSPAQ